jgi:hypothetical protein
MSTKTFSLWLINRHRDHLATSDTSICTARRSKAAGPCRSKDRRALVHSRYATLGEASPSTFLHAADTVFLRAFQKIAPEWWAAA